MLIFDHFYIRDVNYRACGHCGRKPGGSLATIFLPYGGPLGELDREEIMSRLGVPFTGIMSRVTRWRNFSVDQIEKEIASFLLWHCREGTL